MMRLSKADPNMLGCPLDRRINSIEVKVTWVGDVTCHHWTLKKMDIIHLFDNASGVINVSQIGFAIVIANHINNMNRSPSRAIMHARPRQPHVMFGVLAIKGDMACAFC